MELAERVEHLEQQVKTFRPELHFPVTATLEQRVRWLEIVFGEMKARDNHGVYAETPLEEKLETILGNTVYIRPDRITLHSLTADPASVAAGDLWFRSDVSKTKQAIDAVVANARLLRREGDIIPAAEIANLDTAKITSGRFPLSRLGWTASKLLLGAGADADPTEIDVPGGLATFGDGSDGNVTISGNTTLTRDMFYNNLTVNSGITLNTGGYRIFVKETLTNNGTIARNGNNASSGTGGAALAEGSLGSSAAGGNTPSVSGGASGGGGGGGGVVFIAAKTIINTSGVISANGGAGGNGTGAPEGGSPGNAGSSIAHSLGSNGGAGGSAYWAGGAGGTVTAPTAAMGGFRALPFIAILKEIETTVFKMAGGAGGGSGAADSDGKAAGGGGGGGGFLVLVYKSLTAGTEQANGGAFGAGIGGGGNGIAGSAGTVIKIVN